ncbi:MAG TPA: SRPBCC domain-containing protein [Phenylobacterium sp.]
MTETATEVRSVVVEREMPFPPERIWRALTQPHLISEWLMKTDFAAETGRAFTLSGDWGSVDCKVLAIEPGRSLAYSWDSMGLGSTVTWTLEPTAAGTQVRMEQVGFRPDQEHAYQGAKFGWGRFFGNLEQLLAGME